MLLVAKHSDNDDLWAKHRGSRFLVEVIDSSAKQLVGCFAMHCDRFGEIKPGQFAIYRIDIHGLIHPVLDPQLGMIQQLPCFGRFPFLLECDCQRSIDQATGSPDRRLGIEGWMRWLCD
ncbi:MAG: hypothetical protein ACK6AO_10805 [Planctomycetota bacterium]